jgi:hypothetical protein
MNNYDLGLNKNYYIYCFSKRCNNMYKSTPLKISRDPAVYNKKLTTIKLSEKISDNIW